jgi:DNA-binding NarL/FixJ family response regulator
MVNVLIAEDNAAYRHTLHQVLKGRFPFMQVTETADGPDALHEALSRHFDLIFMDVRLPQGNGLDLTRAIKAVFADAVVCVITSHDLPEYRDAALRNGADHFMVKGDSTGEEIVAMVESVLEVRYRTLVVVNDAHFRRQLATLLSIRWPVMIVAEAMDAETGLGHATSLNPDLVLLELDLPGFGVVDLVRQIRARSPQAVMIGMADDLAPSFRSSAFNCGVDYCVPLTPMGHTELVAIVRSLQPKPTHH